MKHLIFLFITLCLATFGQAQEPEQALQTSEEQTQAATTPALPKNASALMDSAMAAYNNGMYSDALTNYRYIVDSLGEESAALYYNMGNAAFKRNDLSAAILFYEKALKLNPNDEDIIFNLGLANSRIPDKIEAVPEMLPVRWYKEITQIFSPNQWAYATLILLGVALILLALYFIAYNVVVRKIGFWVGVVMMFLCVFSFVVARQTAHHQLNHNTAIVFSASLTVKSSPEGSSTDLFVLHEGTKVWILETLNNWYKIKIANGSVGWIETDEVERI